MRKIAFFTGSRSEYGLLSPVIRTVSADPRLAPLIIAGGAHFDEEFGNTCREIEQDGRAVDYCVGGAGGRCSTVEVIAKTILGVSRALRELSPDFLVVYGDRSESFGALVASTQMAVPTAHIEGGDYTEGGALDDAVRHAMTKLAHLHFTTNGGATKRVLRLGEEPWRIVEAGLPALDALRDDDFASPEEIAEGLGLDLRRPVILFCQHSIATEADRAVEQVRPSLAALKEIAAEGVQVVATFPNSDAGGLLIIGELRALEGRSDFHVVPHLGRRRFHGLLHWIGRVGRGALVGNTSAGIKESPAFGCPTVDIGSRQQGRLKADNVLKTGYDEGEICTAIRTCLTDETFRARCRTCMNPYGDGHAGERIANTLAAVELGEILIRKKMTY